jgi:hypothetical protein
MRAVLSPVGQMGQLGKSLFVADSEIQCGYGRGSFDLLQVKESPRKLTSTSSASGNQSRCSIQQKELITRTKVTEGPLILLGMNAGMCWTGPERSCRAVNSAVVQWSVLHTIQGHCEYLDLLNISK